MPAVPFIDACVCKALRGFGQQNTLHFLSICPLHMLLNCCFHPVVPVGCSRGGMFGSNARVYRANFGAQQQRRQSTQQHQTTDQTRAVMGLLQFLPIALIILYTMFQGTSQHQGGQQAALHFLAWPI